MFFFFFKQKTAYEMLRSLVGSEMCIRDRHRVFALASLLLPRRCARPGFGLLSAVLVSEQTGNCLLYTSDAADDLLCVDLGGRRLIKKKNQKTPYATKRPTMPAYEPL